VGRAARGLGSKGMPATCTIGGATADSHSGDEDQDARGQRRPRPQTTCPLRPIEQSTPRTHGHSRTTRYSGSPADRQADPLRKPAFQADAVARRPGSNAVGRHRIAAHRDQRGDLGQGKEPDGLGRLAAWVSLSLNPRVQPRPMRPRQEERPRVVTVTQRQTSKIPAGYGVSR
jgi:hypothetical protein